MPKRKLLVDTPARWRAIYKKYGLTKEAYNEILLKQGGACAICDRTPYQIKPRRHLSVDHDHKTGSIRGLLCYSCNHRLLGYVIKDNVQMAKNLVAYLTKRRTYGKVMGS